MAVTLEISDGTTSVVLTTADESWRLLRYWEPVVATPAGDGSIPPYVTDVLPVIITPTSDDNLAAEIQDLHALALRAAEYWSDRGQATPVWFSRKLNNETNTARVLVRDIGFDVDARFGSWIDACPKVTDGRLGNIAITHHPYWEGTTVVAVSGNASTNVLGGEEINYTDVSGDVSARPYYVRFYGAPAADNYQYIWLGFRSDARSGSDAADYIALWEAEYGSAVAGGGAALANDVTASPGGAGNNYYAINTTTTWASRISITPDQVVAGAGAGDVAAFVGSFVVLMRAKVNTGTEQVKLALVDADASISIMGQPVNISATSWTIYNLGMITLPLRDRKALPTGLFAASYDGGTTLHLWSRDTSGSPTFDVDCFIVLPCDEYFVYTTTGTVTTNFDIYIGVAPEDTWDGIEVGTATTKVQQMCPTTIYGPGIPPGDGRAWVCAAKANNASAAYNDNIGVGISYYDRYLSLRGVS